MTTSTHRCQAVAHVHANGVVHSDVKPDNVLIDASGRPRLGDFDVSKDATVRRTHVFASTRAAGTFGYLAPEVISGGGATEASDVYSLGRTIAQQRVKPSLTPPRHWTLGPPVAKRPLTDMTCTADWVPAGLPHKFCPRQEVSSLVQPPACTCTCICTCDPGACDPCGSAGSQPGRPDRAAEC